MHFVWLLLGLLGALWIFWDTRKQGYPWESSFRWAIGTFFAPAAVIPFYLLQSLRRSKNRSRHHTGNPQDITAQMQVRCSCCGNFYQGNRLTCPHCQRVIKDE